MKTVERLEELQNMFIRRVLQVPVSTPKVSLRSETGLLSMRLRIWAEKVKMVIALRVMDERFLARQVYDEQVKQGWPGLSREVAEICLQIGLPDANVVTIAKAQVDKAIKEYNKGEIRAVMSSNYTKLDELVEVEDGCVKEYMKMKNLAESRMMFRIRTKMLNLKDNMKGKYKRSILECIACDSKEVESQTHVMCCSGYSDIRTGLDLPKDRDLIAYFTQVMKIRMAE